MFIPGRIEFLGKHTDYCGGRSIVCAIDRGFRARVEPRVDSSVVFENVDSGETVAFDLASNTNVPQGHWVNYAVEVGRRLSQNFSRHSLNGATIRFQSDLPKAAGLSSSSALMIMVFAALRSANDLSGTATFRGNIADDLELAEYLGCIENGQSYHGLAGSAGVGTFGGSQDHAAILLGKKGKLSRFAFSPLRRETDLDFPECLVFIIASSGVKAEKTGTELEKYNRLSMMVSDITQMFGEGRSLEDIVSDVGFEELRNVVWQGSFHFSRNELISRLRQFQFENYEAIPIVSTMIAQEDISGIGRIIDMSQQFAETCLENQTPETIFLQRSARSLGAVAASAFGAGFGGSVYALVRTHDAEHFISEWCSVYAERFPQHRATSEFFITRPSQCSL